MRDLSQAFWGMLAALISSLLVFGGLTISLAEGSLQLALAPEQSPTLTLFVPTQRPGEPTYTPSPTPLPTSTPTLVISDVCPYPDGWIEVFVDFGDDFASLASRYNISVEELRENNCLDMRALMPGMTVYVPNLPPSPTVTNTPVIPTVRPNPTRLGICPRPYGWVIYYVRPGDTLFRISLARGITYQELMRRNCLASININPGQRLYVPNVPVLLPTSTPVPFYPPTQTPPASTLTSVPPTLVPPTATPIAESVTPVLPSSTPVTPPTGTAVPPTSTDAPPPPTLAPTTPPPSAVPPTAIPPTSPPTIAPLPSATATSIPLPTRARPTIVTVTGEAISNTPTPQDR